MKKQNLDGQFAITAHFVPDKKLEEEDKKNKVLREFDYCDWVSVGKEHGFFDRFLDALA